MYITIIIELITFDIYLNSFNTPSLSQLSFNSSQHLLNSSTSPSIYLSIIGIFYFLSIFSFSNAKRCSSFFFSNAKRCSSFFFSNAKRCSSRALSILAPFSFKISDALILIIFFIVFCIFFFFFFFFFFCNMFFFSFFLYCFLFIFFFLINNIKFFV